MSKVNFLKSATLAVAGLAVITSVSSCAMMNKKEEKNSCKAAAGKEKNSCKATAGKEKNSCKGTSKKEAKKPVEAATPAEAKKAN